MYNKNNQEFLQKENSNLFLDYSILLNGYIEELKLLYDRDRNNNYSQDLYDRIKRTEKSTPGFILDFSVYMDIEDYKSGEEEILKKIVVLSRKFLEQTRDKDCKKDSLALMCKIMTNIISRTCDMMGIENYPFDFVNDIMEHRAIILKLKTGNYYLMDLTYQQFFLNGNNLPERHVTRFWRVQGPYVGYHMVSKGFLLTARNIIEKGFVSIDKSEFKQYMDGFVNALYEDESKDKFLNYSNSEYFDEIKNKGVIK